MSSCRSRRAASPFLLLLRSCTLACTLAGALSALAQPQGLETGERVMPVEVTVNGGAGGIWPIVSRDGVLYAPVEAFTNWRVQVRPDTPVVDYRGFRYYPISAVPGITSRLEPDTGVLILNIRAESFAATRLTRELSSVLPRTPVVPAAFVNYDINFSETQGPVPTRGLGLLGEAGLSGSWGVLTQTFAARNLVAESDRGVTRLETTYRRDFPDAGYTLTLGDSVFRTAQLGRAAYFGGLQFGTNFSLAPHINRQPVPLIAGETSAPSTVQLYVNDVLRQTSRVPAGPFTLDNLPVLNGNGEVTVRVRDILGRETLITQPFFVTAELLAVGMNDWSFETGKLRRDLGTASAHYGEGFAAGMIRRGLSVTTTGEARLEWATHRRTAGLAAVHAFGNDWLFRGGAIASDDKVLGRGSRWMIGFERPDYHGSFSAMLEGNSRGFRSLGEDTGTIPVRLQFAGQGSWATKWGRIGMTIAMQRPFDAESVSTYSINFTRVLFANWQLNAYYTRAFGSVDGYTLGAVLSVPIGGRRTVSSTSVQLQRNRTEFYTSVSQSPASTTGWAWRAMAAHQGTPRVEGGVNYLSRHGLFSAEVSARPRETDLRFGAVGGVLWTQKKLYAVRRFESSAALVQVAGYPDVGVSLGIQDSEPTDPSGMALVTRLQPYQKNPIRLNANDLPISAEVESIEQEVVPPWRSVAKVDFQVRGGRSALITVNLEDGEPVPPGAIVRIQGEERDFYVARRGEAYLTGLKDSNRLQLRWRDASCALQLDLPREAPDDIPRVGPLRCPGVPR